MQSGRGFPRRQSRSWSCTNSRGRLILSYLGSVGAARGLFSVELRQGITDTCQSSMTVQLTELADVSSGLTLGHIPVTTEEFEGYPE